MKVFIIILGMLVSTITHAQYDKRYTEGEFLTEANEDIWETAEWYQKLITAEQSEESSSTESQLSPPSETTLPVTTSVTVQPPSAPVAEPPMTTTPTPAPVDSVPVAEPPTTTTTTPAPVDSVPVAEPPMTTTPTPAPVDSVPVAEPPTTATQPPSVPVAEVPAVAPPFMVFYRLPPAQPTSGVAEEATEQPTEEIIEEEPEVAEEATEQPTEEIIEEEPETETADDDCEKPATYTKGSQQAFLPVVEIPLYTDIDGQRIDSHLIGLFAATLQASVSFSSFEVATLKSLGIATQSEECHAKFNPSTGILEIPQLNVSSVAVMGNQTSSGPLVKCRATLQQSEVRLTILELTKFDCTE